MTEHAIKHSHKPTAKPPSTIIAVTENSPSIRLLGTCALAPSPREAVGSLYLLLGGAGPILRAGAQRQFLSRSNSFVGLARHNKLGTDVGVGVVAQYIGLLYGWGLLRLFRSCRHCEEVRG